MADFVTLRFDRKSIVALNLRAPLFALEQMIVNTSVVREFAGRVRITFEGFDELSDVFMDPSVQRFVSELTDLFPYWLHFADKNDDTLRLLMSCLLPPRRVDPGPDNKPLGEVNVAAWNDQMARLRAYTSRLHAQFGLSEDESRVIDQAVAAWSNRVGLTAAENQENADR